ncbi:MAG: Gfo/Idh/MocA family oxidoreductase, partial [Chloroflexaceae bacterium]|nr:Gfo/Idh/MocA family oxidoreductase [Chloroflexaceae bacterium]
VIYIATPHPLHYPDSLLCLQAGKAVLCEKPFTLNAREAADLIAYARQHQLFLMEAMWTRFLPVMAEVRRLLAVGAIGTVQMVEADFGFWAPYQMKSRLFDPALGGGALLDVGVYPLALASMVFGEQPQRIESVAKMGQTGVDEQSAAMLSYRGGGVAFILAATRTRTDQTATITGTAGSIHLPARWWCGQRLVLAQHGQRAEVIRAPMVGNGYSHEAIAVREAIQAGRIESDIMPLDETLGLLETMDTIRAQWGMVYPGEA